MSQFQITISRAHKIAERLGQRASEAKDRAEKLCDKVSLQGYTEAQLERLRAQSGEATSALELSCRLNAAQAVVRAAIGRANAANGVGDTLATIEGNKKSIAAMQAVVGKQSAESYGSTTVMVDDLENFRPLGQVDRAPTLSVRLLSEEATKDIEQRIQDMERKNFALNDTLADLNGRTLSLDLDDDIAVLVGLKA